jgi:hypothetical protein
LYQPKHSNSSNWTNSFIASCTLMACLLQQRQSKRM